MNNERKDKVLDYLSRPLDEVANLERQNGRSTNPVNSNGAFPQDESWNARSRSRRGAAGYSRGGQFSSSRNRRYYFRNSSNSFRGRNSRRTVSYRGRNTYSGPSQKFSASGKFASVRSRRGKGTGSTSRRGLIRNTSRKIFKKTAGSVRKVLDTAPKSYTTERAGIKKYGNMNISLHRKNEIFPSSANRAKDGGRIGRGVQNRTSTQGNNIVNGRKVVNASRFEPLNKQALSKIKIVTSLQKVPSPLKEQQDTAVNLPESLNNMRR